VIRVVRVYLLEAGLPAAARAAPLYFGVLVVATILFGGPNAMRAADATHAFAASRPLRMLFWVAWIAAAAPAARILIQTPSTYYLRTLPRTGAAIAVALALGLAAIESPWIALYARGAGPLAGLTVALVAAGLHAAVVAPAPLAALVLAALLLWPLPDVGFLAIGVTVAVLAVRSAYRRAPERAARRRRGLVVGPAPVALALAYLACALRSTPAALTRGILVAIAGGALTALVAHNNTAEGSIALALGMTGPILIVAAGGVVEALAVAEREASWLLITTRSGDGVQRGARAAATAAVGAALALVSGAVVVGYAGGGVALVAAEALWGAALALLVATGARLACRGPKRNGGAAVTWSVLLAIGAATVAGLFGGTALAIFVPAALLGVLLA
jgi:hypothetical protein